MAGEFPPTDTRPIRQSRRVAVKQAGFVPKSGLHSLGLKNLNNVYWNLSVPALYEEAVRRHEGSIADGGAFVVNTSVHTAPAPNDKFFPEGSPRKARIDW